VTAPEKSPTRKGGVVSDPASQTPALSESPTRKGGVVSDPADSPDARTFRIPHPEGWGSFRSSLREGGSRLLRGNPAPQTALSYRSSLPLR
jgi:hypothetical protein